ncbi:hypothetical protein OC835_004187 [Tilletia horrida]|nr:hypothetical protein OC835_004187 [Tilletia horrida]
MASASSYAAPPVPAIITTTPHGHARSDEDGFAATPHHDDNDDEHDEEHDDDNDDNDDDDDDDDATIGIRTPRLSAQRTVPYTSFHNNLSQATITPLPEQPQPQQHTYTSLGSHLDLEHSAPSPSQPQPSPDPPPTPPSSQQPQHPSSLLSTLYTTLRTTFSFSRTRTTTTTTPHRLSSAALFTLTLALAGAQLTWTLELAYGNLFLLSLGLSKPHSALVWLAGPLSGLIAQPLIGALSDRIPPHSPWRRYRRRLFLVLSAVVLTLSTALLAFVEPCARFLVDAILRIGEADWDPDRIEAVEATTKFLAILAFWILDLALNALQAAARALILDVAPRQQQSQANAWHGRMTHAGNVLGYAAGWADLGSTLPFLHWLGGGQFRKLAIFSLVGMLLCVAVTCISTREPLPSDAAAQQQQQQQQQQQGDDSAIVWAGGSPPLSHQQQLQQQPDIERPAPSASSSRQRTSSSRTKHTSNKKKNKKKKHSRSTRKEKRTPQNSLSDILSHILHATRTLPKPLARVCIVQLFAFSAWFPFLFFSTTYVVELERVAFPDQGGDRDTERGSFALMLYAIVALVAGSALPYLAVAARRQAGEQQEGKGHGAAVAAAETGKQNGTPGRIPSVSLPPPTTETAGGTVIYQRDGNDAHQHQQQQEHGAATRASSSSSATAVGDGAAAEEERVAYTSLADHRLRLEAYSTEDDDEDEDDHGHLGADEHSALLSPGAPRRARPRRLAHLFVLPTLSRPSLTLRTLWTLGSLLTFLLLTLGTLLLPLFLPAAPEAQVSGAMVLVACMGVPWAVASWVPFALLGEFLKEAEERGDVVEDEEEGGGGGGGAGAGGAWGEADGAGAREGVRAALVDCEPLPLRGGGGGAQPASAPSSSSPARNSPLRRGRRPTAALRRLPSDLPDLSSDDDEDDEDDDHDDDDDGLGGSRAARSRGARRRNGASGRPHGGSAFPHASYNDEDEATGADGLRILPGSEAYVRRLEEEERRRAAAAAAAAASEAGARRRRSRRRRMEEEEDDEEDGEEEEEEEEEDEEDDGEDEDEHGRRGRGQKGAVTSAGTILGIHNLAIVLPQFFVALVATLIFRLSAPPDSTTSSSSSSSPNSVQGVVWVLRFGGLMALLAACATRFVPLTRTEREAEAEREREVGRRARAKARARARERARDSMRSPQLQVQVRAEAGSGSGSGSGSGPAHARSPPPSSSSASLGLDSAARRRLSGSMAPMVGAGSGSGTGRGA